MKTIVVEKNKLIKKIQENLAKHDEIYAEAIENYWKSVAEQLKNATDEAKETIKNREIDNGGIRINIYLDAPENHKDDYVRALEMLEWEMSSEIELDDREYDSYVRNNWSWKHSFLMSNALYTSNAITQSF